MADELAALAHNPYRYVAGGLCEHAGTMVEHLETVFALVHRMVLAWPVEDCPICSYFVCNGLEFDHRTDTGVSGGCAHCGAPTPGVASGR
jgi:hypothetical protein